MQWIVPGLTALVCLGGAGVAAVFASKYPGPALLTLIGMVLLAFVTIAVQASTSLIVARRVSENLTTQQTSNQLFAAAIGFGLLRIIAYGLLVTAVFLGRRPALPPPPLPGAVPRPPY